MIPRWVQKCPRALHFLQAFYFQNHLMNLVIFLSKTFTTLTHGQNTHGHYTPIITCSLLLFRRVIQPFWQTNDIRTCHWYVSAKWLNITRYPAKREKENCKRPWARTMTNCKNSITVWATTKAWMEVMTQKLTPVQNFNYFSSSVTHPPFSEGNEYRQVVFLVILPNLQNQQHSSLLQFLEKQLHRVNLTKYETNHNIPAHFEQPTTSNPDSPTPHAPNNNNTEHYYRPEIHMAHLPTAHSLPNPYQKTNYIHINITQPTKTYTN